MFLFKQVYYVNTNKGKQMILYFNINAFSEFWGDQKCSHKFVDGLDGYLTATVLHGFWRTFDSTLILP